jgi:hypothetical protein
MKRVLLFWGIGVAMAAAIFGFASALPSIFGIFTLPFWVLPGLAGFGAHDNILLLGLLGASLFYGVVSFLLFRFVVRRRATQNSK